MLKLLYALIAIFVLHASAARSFAQTVEQGEFQIDEQDRIELEQQALDAAMESNPLIRAVVEYDRRLAEEEIEVGEMRLPEDVAPQSTPGGAIGELFAPDPQFYTDLVVLDALSERRLTLVEPLPRPPNDILREAVEHRYNDHWNFDPHTLRTIRNARIRAIAVIATARRLFVINPYAPGNGSGGSGSSICDQNCLPCPAADGNCYAGDNSFLVKINRNGALRCSGVALSKSVFMTAAHCFVNLENSKLYPSSDFSVAVGNDVHPIASFSIHPRYSSKNAEDHPGDCLAEWDICHPDHTFDVAIVKLRSDSRARNADLYHFNAQDFSHVPPGDPVAVTFAGFGYTNAIISNYAGPLFGAQFLPRNAIDPAPASSLLFSWDHDLVQTGRASANCRYDSGGPIIRQPPPFSSGPIEVLGVLSGLDDGYAGATEAETTENCYKNSGGKAVNLVATPVREGLCALLSSETGISCVNSN